MALGGCSCGVRVQPWPLLLLPSCSRARLFTAESALRSLCRCGPSPSICLKCAAFESDLDWNIQVDRPVYKDPATGKCTVCTAHPRSTGCVTCSGQGRCSTCDEGFVLVNGACKKVSHGCGWGNCAAAVWFEEAHGGRHVSRCSGSRRAVLCCVQ